MIAAIAPSNIFIETQSFDRSIRVPIVGQFRGKITADSFAKNACQYNYLGPHLYTVQWMAGVLAVVVLLFDGPQE